MLNLSSENLQFYLQRSQDLLELGNVEQAINEIEKALKIDVNYVYGLNELAAIYEQQQQLDLALEYRQQVVELQPTNHSAYDHVGKVLMAQGRLEEAILVYKKSLSLSDSPAYIYWGLANALEQNGQLETATALYQHASKLFPENQELAEKQNQSEKKEVQPYSYFFQQGRELISQGHYDQAIAIYTEGNKQHNEHPFSYFMLGNAYGFVNNYAQELSFYHQALQLDLNNFQLNLTDKASSRSTLNDNQISNIYQKIVQASINSQQIQNLPQLIEVASHRLHDYSFFLATTRELASLDKFDAAITFLEEAISPSIELKPSDSERAEIQSLLIRLKQAQGNQQAVKDRNYKIIALGSDSFPVELASDWGLKPSRQTGELSCPFDLALHSYESVVKAIDTDFNNYLHRDYLISTEASLDNDKTFTCVKNTYYNCLFPNEKGDKFTNNDFVKFIEIYRQRITNFYQYINSSPILFLVHSQHSIEINSLVEVLSGKFPRLNFKVMLILSSKNTLPSIDVEQDAIIYRVSSFEQYVDSSTHEDRIAYEQNISNQIKSVILDNF